MVAIGSKRKPAQRSITLWTRSRNHAWFVVISVLLLLGCIAFWLGNWANNVFSYNPDLQGWEDDSSLKGFLQHNYRAARRNLNPVSRLRRDGLRFRLHDGQAPKKLHVDTFRDGAMPVPHPTLGMGQVLVHAPETALLSIMTPVQTDSHTLELLHNQLKSANVFLQMDTFHEWLLITPSNQTKQLAGYVEGLLDQMPCIPHAKIRVLADEVCAPELAPSELQRISLHTTADGRLRGWVKQQLVKLACSFEVRTPYFLTTDADTFFLSDLSALSLMEQQPCTPGSQVCSSDKETQYRARNELQGPLQDHEQCRWMFHSAEALNMPKIWVNAQNRTMGVTPQVFSTQIVNNMAYYIQNNISGSNETWRSYLLELAFEAEFLLNGMDDSKRAGWTEFDLYWIYSQDQGLWDRFHVDTELQKVEANLWTDDELPSWDPCQSTQRKHDGYWAVAQSFVSLSAAQIWEKLAPCMHVGGTMDQNSTRGKCDVATAHGTYMSLS